MIDIRGFAPDLESAIGPFANAGLAGISIIATSANAAVSDPEVEVAYEITSGAKEREYFQSCVPPAANVIHTSRIVDVSATISLWNALEVHRDVERLLRATNQYNLALQRWKFGHATMSLAHLWMAIEALTKVKLRAECSARGLFDHQDLAAALQIDIKQLDSTIRRDFLLRGDDECYKRAKEASDGFEHGYLGFDCILDLSQKIRHKTADYVRASIFELAGLDDDAKARLLSDSFRPLGHWPVVKYLRGTLRAERDDLAAPGRNYPFIRWSTEITRCELDDEGKLQVEFNEKLTAELAEGVTFWPQSIEAWRPD